MEDIHTRLNPQIAQQIVNDEGFNFQEFVDFLIHNVSEYYFINNGANIEDIENIIETDLGVDLNNLNDLGFEERVDLLYNLRDNIQAIDEENDPVVANAFINNNLLEQLDNHLQYQALQEQQELQEADIDTIFPRSPPGTPPPPFMEGNGGGELRKGYHKMPDGTIMKDSEHSERRYSNLSPYRLFH